MEIKYPPNHRNTCWVTKAAREHHSHSFHYELYLFSKPRIQYTYIRINGFCTGTAYRQIFSKFKESSRENTLFFFFFLIEKNINNCH